ncbi:hypothetical protein [Flavobacterium sp.]|uniref:hypothetical protein n=1 Tax=Flavobacterium sp. TaxID=239 RepID=UPI0038FC1AE9
MKILGQKNQFRKIHGFWKFAFLPTELVSGETIWLKFHYIAGIHFVCSNRNDCGKKTFEIKYSKESA